MLRCFGGGSAISDGIRDESSALGCCHTMLDFFQILNDPTQTFSQSPTFQINFLPIPISPRRLCVFLACDSRLHLASVCRSSTPISIPAHDMEAAKRPALPLLLGGAALSTLGALPLLEVGYAVRQAGASAEKVQLLLALTALDESAITLSALAAVLGGALLAFHWVELPVHAALKAAKLLATALAVAALADAALLTSVASHRGPDTPWRAETYADHEGLFEQQVNDVFCHAKGLQVCALGSVAEARQVFPLENWPVDSDRAPGRRIAISCEGFKDKVQLWDYQSKMELCRLCGNITAQEQQLQAQLGAEHTAQVLAAVELLSFGELQWCGEYLAVRRPEHDVGHSPYWKHRREFQALLEYDTPPCRLFFAVRVLQLLEVVASLCCLALVRWTWALQTLKFVQEKDGGKVDAM
ncbi:hypothetical protein PHYPSEUDO_011857 [Phytophthora pseudosyringae]|uniref:Uncharacterized protein n=1 Tax=Phytophthora pseudosyringae TaxID=221518 RepID=A0A8T1V7Q1_9STRA|nr:hypothetical protein PHYPSEUDO_011857 [Phytophthora pseudosyringae]